LRKEATAARMVAAKAKVAARPVCLASAVPPEIAARAAVGSPIQRCSWDQKLAAANWAFSELSLAWKRDHMFEAGYLSEKAFSSFGVSCGDHSQIFSTSRARERRCWRPRDRRILPSPFPGALEARMLLEEDGGVWYEAELQGHSLKGWLCGHFFDYFETAPPIVYVRGMPPAS
jgi:hypothetical protein